MAAIVVDTHAIVWYLANNPRTHFRACFAGLEADFHGRDLLKFAGSGERRPKAIENTNKHGV